MDTKQVLEELKRYQCVDVKPGYTDMRERSNGPYVLYADVVELLNELKGNVTSVHATFPESPAGNYIQRVPDHCDRVVWRGRYYMLDEPSGELLAQSVEKDT